MPKENQLPRRSLWRRRVTKPRIEDVDVSKYTGKPGSKIRFKAYETYPLEEVSVSISGANGAHEQGTPKVRGKTWTYTANTTMPPGKVNIHLYARDHATQGTAHRAEWTSA